MGAEIERAPAPPIPTYKLLDDIVTVLGTTKTTFFPFVEGRGGTDLFSYGSGTTAHELTPTDEASNFISLEGEYSPVRHVGGVHSYKWHDYNNSVFDGTDHADYEFPSNVAFSCGAFILPIDINSVTIMGKYDVNVQREWRLSLDASSKIELESYDETNNQDRTGASDTAIAVSEWSFIAATTDGADADASMSFYLNGVADGTGNTESGAAYASQPGTTSRFAIGATYNTEPAVTALYSGRIALPFVTGKELTAAELSEIYTIGRKLLGLA